MKAKSVKPIKPSMDYLTGKHDGYEQGKKDADGIKATLLIERDKKARKQTLKEVLKDIVIQEDIYEKEDKQKELLALYRFRIQLEQKLREMVK